MFAQRSKKIKALRCAQKALEKKKKQFKIIGFIELIGAMKCNLQTNNILGK